MHPFYGWDQGRLRIVRDRLGKERVVTARGRPVVGLGADARIVGAAALTTGAGPAKGVETDPNASLEQALSPAVVKGALAIALGGTQ